MRSVGSAGSCPAVLVVSQVNSVCDQLINTVSDANLGSGIYPVETVKTQMMSNIGGQRPTLLDAMKHVYKLGGMRAYYRGLAVSRRNYSQRNMD